MDRLFFALRPASDVADAIGRSAGMLLARHRLRGTSIEPGRLHLSLHAVGTSDGLPPALLARAKEAAGSVRMAAFDLALSRAVSFAGRRPGRPLAFLADGRTGPLHELHARLGRAMKTCAIGRYVSPSFRPHMTVFYGEAIAQDQMIAPIRWRVRDFALVHSPWSQRRHITLAVWPLADEAER